MEREVRLFLFRHGETDWNVEGRFQGHLDIPLNDRGRVQARGVGEKLRKAGIETILASDLGRALETARIVAQEVGLSESGIHQEPGLREAYLGKAQGLTVEEIRANLGAEVLERWKSNHLSDADISYPGGESASEVLRRAMDAIRNFVHDHPHFTRIGIATHGGVIRRVMHRLLSLSGTKSSGPIAIPNGVVYEITYFPQQERWDVPRPPTGL